MNRNVYAIRVKEIMSRDVVSIRVEDSLHDALQLMAANRVAAMPVVDKREHCIGMLSTTDLVDVTLDVDGDLEQLEHGDQAARGWLMGQLVNRLGHERIDSIMTENVATVRPETLLAEAAREMLRNRVHRLPVVDESDRLIGIISTMDVLEAFASNSPP